MTSGFVVIKSRTRTMSVSIYSIPGAVLGVMPLRLLSLLRPLFVALMFMLMLKLKLMFIFRLRPRLLGEAGRLLSIVRVPLRDDGRRRVIQGNRVRRAVASNLDFVYNGNVDCRI